ncbi:hypothetical protein QEZ54_17800 [Catellatospora sp. KI3]|uniref:hypothetical protein n=1 Tax=Catellatospora sp. KI3 TaxID=3041620 RepID=UPI00248244C6|nr:hypothetical protein [Catellatospora sp. KI3]MDI1462833.1 hypothetical protein [Catellatospora sp. KI3]
MTDVQMAPRPRRWWRRGRTDADQQRPATWSLFEPSSWVWAWRQRAAARELARRRAAVLPTEAAQLRWRNALVGRAEAAALADARSSMFDEWSFGTATSLPPHLKTLRRFAAQDVAAARLALADLAQFERDHFHVRTSDEAVLRSRLELVTQLRDESATMSRRAIVRLDRLANRQAWRREVFRFFGRSRQDPSTARVLADRDLNPEPVEGTIGRLGLDPMPERVPWEGAQAPVIGKAFRALTLLGLILVELPITFRVFQQFHGRTGIDLVMTAMIALPVACAMILLPHFTGRFYRYRHATGREWFAISLCAVLIVPWAVVAWWLGSLRAAIIAMPPAPGQVHYPTVIERMGVGESTIAAIFISMMFITGGLGLLLGLARTHPLQDAFGRANRERHRLERRLARIRPVIATGQPPSDEELRERADRRCEAIEAGYAAAEHAYLGRLARALGNPAATESIARLSDQVANQRENPQEELV